MSGPTYVLDDGEVELIECMPLFGRQWITAIADSARVSYGSQSKSWDDDLRLVKYLLRHGHWSPFEHVVLKFRVKLPIFVARQWMRHTSWHFNEMSGRYKELPNEMYLPTEFRAAGGTNKQGSVPGNFTEADLGTFQLMVRQAYNEARNTYEFLRSSGVADELARIVLPVGQYTEFYATVNLRDFIFFLKARLDEHAQWEIRQYAEAMFDDIHVQSKELWTLIYDHVIEARTISRGERWELEQYYPILSEPVESILSAREKVELIAKLQPPH